MTKKEYQDAVRTVALTARVLSAHDIPAILRAIEHTDTVAPFLDPTLWQRNRDKMLEDRAMLRAALPLHELAQQLWPDPDEEICPT